MKTLIALLVVVASQVSGAAINYSNYEKRHQELIKNAVENACGYAGTLEQVNSQEVIDQVDQGIRDVYYSTTLNFKVRIDQNIYDNYRVVVNSAFADMYDHVTKNWGAYSVEKVQCYNN